MANETQAIPIVAICSGESVGTYYVHRYDYETKVKASDLVDTWTAEMSAWLKDRPK